MTTSAADASAPAAAGSDEGRPSQPDVACCTPDVTRRTAGADAATADDDTATEDVPSTPPPPPAKRRRLTRHPGGLPLLTENRVPVPADVSGSVVAGALLKEQQQHLQTAPPPRPYDVPLYVAEGRAPLPPSLLSPTLLRPPKVERSRDALTRLLLEGCTAAAAAGSGGSSGGEDDGDAASVLRGLRSSGGACLGFEDGVSLAASLRALSEIVGSGGGCGADGGGPAAQQHEQQQRQRDIFTRPFVALLAAQRLSQIAGAVGESSAATPAATSSQQRRLRPSSSALSPPPPTLPRRDVGTDAAAWGSGWPPFVAAPCAAANATPADASAAASGGSGGDDGDLVQESGRDGGCTATFTAPLGAAVVAARGVTPPFALSPVPGSARDAQGRGAPALRGTGGAGSGGGKGPLFAGPSDSEASCPLPPPPHPEKPCDGGREDAAPSVAGTPPLAVTSPCRIPRRRLVRTLLKLIVQDATTHSSWTVPLYAAATYLGRARPSPYSVDLSVYTARPRRISRRHLLLTTDPATGITTVVPLSRNTIEMRMLFPSSSSSSSSSSSFVVLLCVFLSPHPPTPPPPDNECAGGVFIHPSSSTLAL